MSCSIRVTKINCYSYNIIHQRTLNVSTRLRNNGKFRCEWFESLNNIENVF